MVTLQSMKPPFHQCIKIQYPLLLHMNVFAEQQFERRGHDMNTTKCMIFDKNLPCSFINPEWISCTIPSDNKYILHRPAVGRPVLAPVLLMACH